MRTGRIVLIIMATLGLSLVGCKNEALLSDTDIGLLLISSPSTPLVADAGANQAVTTPTTVTLDGSASTGGALTYAWTLASRPSGSSATLSNPTSVNPTFTPDIPGRYVAQLVVSNGGGATSAASTVSVAVSGDVITNGSFESGLNNWTVATNLEGFATGTASYNGVIAPGTEALTSVAGFAATAGTKLALGSVASTNNSPSIINSVLYQDVFIPVGATSATFSFDIGIKDAANGNNSCNAACLGLYSDATVPAFGDPTVFGGATGKVIYSQPNDAALQSRASASFDVSARAGTTVRFAIINAANLLGHEVIGIDNVKLTVTVAN